MATVTVLYFAVLRERRGRASEVVHVAEGTTVSELYAGRFPVGPEGRLPVAFARNGDYVDASAVVVDGDEVALLPPLGGG